MSNTDLNAAKKLELIGVNKYWKRVSLIEIELNLLYDQISILATFIRYSKTAYNIKELG